jgi:hypothetical protein
MLVSLMKKSVYSHECADKGPVFLIRLFTIGSARGVAWAAVAINRGDYF